MTLQQQLKTQAEIAKQHQWDTMSQLLTQAEAHIQHLENIILTLNHTLQQTGETKQPTNKNQT